MSNYWRHGKNPAEVEAELRKMQEPEDDLEDDDCACEEFTDGFKQCNWCQRKKQRELAQERAAQRQRPDVPETEVPF